MAKNKTQKANQEVNLGFNFKTRLKCDPWRLATVGLGVELSYQQSH
jgi:hypothetical protein